MWCGRQHSISALCRRQLAGNSQVIDEITNPASQAGHAVVNRGIGFAEESLTSDTHLTDCFQITTCYRDLNPSIKVNDTTPAYSWRHANLCKGKLSDGKSLCKSVKPHGLADSIHKTRH